MNLPKPKSQRNAAKDWLKRLTLTCVILTALMAMLRLSETFPLPWWVVALPIWFPVAAFALLVFGIIVMAMVVEGFGW